MFVYMGLAVIIALLASACDKHDEAQAPVTLALEAWIDNDGYPVAILTRALTPSDRDINAADMMVRWGRVAITDGCDTVVMTGGADATVFPPYSYRDFTIKGRIGATYTVVADYHGAEIRATSTLLPPPRIDAIEFEAISDSLCAATLVFTAPAPQIAQAPSLCIPHPQVSDQVAQAPSLCITQDTCRYVVMTRVLGRESRHYPAWLGAVSSYTPSQQCRVPLYRGKHSGNRDPFQPDFCRGDTIDVILARVDESVYNFWRGYQDAVYFDHNIFISTSSSPPSNVIGGYGIFSARGIARTLAPVK